MHAAASYNPASFRDPEGRVFESHGRVFRTLSDEALDRMRALDTGGLLGTFAKNGLIVPTKLVSAQEAGVPPDEAGATLLEHDRIPVASYPYEWCFDMLRDGALVTLDLLDQCLAQDLVLKDGTAFNVMPVGSRMTFIDILSIDRYAPGQPWEGYTQFCQEFLFPLMLTAFKGTDFRFHLRGSMTGIKAAELARLARPRDWLRSGFFKHAVLQAMLSRSMEKRDVAIRSEFDDAKLPKEALRKTVQGLRSVVDGLTYSSAGSNWIAYSEEHSYEDTAHAAKQGFVRDAMQRLVPTQVVDIGCNVGEYSEIAAETAARVVALDIDPACVNALYCRLRDHSARSKILPLVADLTNPTPAQGWALAERLGLFERIRSDAFLALALVHHICISANIPIGDFVSVLKGIAPAGVVEWVDKSDDMVQRLLRNRKDVFATYDWDHFKAALESAFRIEAMQESHGGRRKLCLLTPL